MPDDCGSTETVSGNGMVKPASLPATVAVSVRDGAGFICEVEVQPLMPAAATITPITIRVCFAGKPRTGPVRRGVKKFLTPAIPG
ncbi:hypothetical protein GCM10007881_32550 [Mesorhizobium huakuii]|nr:hypothetical protein GCM10007881_32550 [Mesorhizobium huakuii]